MTLISTFLEEHSSRIWGVDVEQSEKHHCESLSKCLKFLSFSDMSTRHFADVTTSDIMDFSHWMKSPDYRGRRRTENTVNHYRSALSKLFHYAEEYGVITKDQIPSIKFKKIKEQDPHFYSPEQIPLIQDYLAGHRHRWLLHMFNIALCTGMRRGEIWGVTRESIKWIDGEMFVHISHPKNGYSRDVPISVDAMLAFEAVDWAFPKTSGGKFPEHVHRTAWNEIRRVICKGKKMANYHASRHTAATTLSNDMSTNLALVSIMLGHKDITTTQKYVHEKPSTLTGLATRLSEISLRVSNG